MASRLSLATQRYIKRREISREKHKKNVVQGRKAFLSNAYDGASPDSRMGVLKDMSEVVVKMVSYDDLMRHRHDFDRVKNKVLPLLGLPCWVCRERPAAHRHHVILLKHGGYVSSKKNLVPLCEECHAEIHPWMEANRVKTVSAADFELAKCKNAVSVLLEKAAKGKFSDIQQVEVLFSEYLSTVFNILADKM